MPTYKPFKKIDEQIEILKKRNLLFISEEDAEKKLRRYGYYEIINGYKKPFLSTLNSDNDFYKEDTTFEHIFQLFQLDKILRSLVMGSLEDFEQSFRQVLAYTIAEEISVNQVNYLAKSHYNTGKKRRVHKANGKIIQEWDRDITLDRLTRITKSNAQPYKHYREDFGNIPPWILVKGLTFGNLVYWFKLSKPDIRNIVISRLLNVDRVLVESNSLKIKQFFGDIIGLYLDYRNLSAHNGRIYDHRSYLHSLEYSPFLYNKDRIDISKTEFKSGKMRSSLGIVLYTLSFFENKQPYKNLLKGLQLELSLYLKVFKDDKELLFKSMELDDALKLLINKKTS